MSESPTKLSRKNSKKESKQEIFKPDPIKADGTEKGNGWLRLSEYYRPKCIMVGMMFNSILNAMAWPLMGWLQTKLMFSLILMYYDLEKG